jgi:hypothetical protein
MTTRLQVLFEDAEMDEIRAIASQERTTVAEWVRQSLRHARTQKRVTEPGRKLAVVREAAARYEFPVSDPRTMEEEIARGYADEQATS